MAYRRHSTKVLRDEMGLTQQQLAERLGVEERTIRRWENDGVSPSPLAMHRLREVHREHRLKQQRDNTTPTPSAAPRRQTATDNALTRAAGIIPSTD